ncbi:MAG: DUF3035 domain-containing protein, partial [Pseudomonadota bacterium]
GAGNGKRAVTPDLKSVRTQKNRQEKPVRTTLALIVLAASLAVSGCADKGLRILKAPGSGPDEFAVLPVKPLTEPKDFAVLPAPTPGGSNLTDQTPKQDAVLALGGRPSAIESDGIPSSDSALVAAASRYGVPSNTRVVLAEEDAEFRRRRGRFTNIRLFPVDRYSQAYNRQAVDPRVIEERYRRAGFTTPSAPPPE